MLLAGWASTLVAASGIDRRSASTYADFLPSFLPSFLPIGCALLLAGSLLAQKPAPLPSPDAVELGQLYERVLVVCPLVGKGTYADPKRPALVPQQVRANGARGLDAVRAFAWVPSDDGKQAIVEILVRDETALAEFRRTASAAADTALYERGKQPPAVVDEALRRVKKDFDRNSLRAVAP